MQIVKGDHNSRLRKNEGIHLRKCIPKKIWHKTSRDKKHPSKKTSLSPVCPFDAGGVVGNTMAGKHHGCPGGVPCSIQSKEENWEMRRQRLGANDLPAGRTPDDDDDYESMIAM